MLEQARRYTALYTEILNSSPTIPIGSDKLWNIVKLSNITFIL